jgi:hypothetical protein
VKVIELLESQFSVEHQLGRNKRAHDMSLDKVNDSVMFSHAEKKRIAKLQPEQTVTFQRSDLDRGRTIIRVTRKS